MLQLIGDRRASQFMSFGMFSGSQQSTEDDFRDAEFGSVKGVRMSCNGEQKRK